MVCHMDDGKQANNEQKRFFMQIKNLFFSCLISEEKKLNLRISDDNINSSCF